MDQCRGRRRGTGKLIIGLDGDNMHILITGGAGFIGSHVADLLVEAGYKVRVLDALVEQVHGKARQRPGYLHPAVDLVIGEIENPVVLHAAMEGVQAVIHLAAAVGVGQSMYQIVDYCRTNVMGTAVLLEELIRRKSEIKSLVVASSMSAYGEGSYRTPCGEIIYPDVRPDAQLASGDWELRDKNGDPLEPVATNETKPLCPRSVYAINKRDQEEMCLSVAGAYGIPATALRFFNAYGSRQALSNPYTGVAAIFCARLLNDQPPLVFEDGQQQRDFVHVRDLARAVVAAMEKPVTGEVVNIGSGEPITVRQIACLLAESMGKAIEPLTLGKYRKGDIRHCFADVSKAARVLEWKPRSMFREGVSELIDWVKLQRAGKDKVDNAWNELRSRGLVS